MLKLNRFGPVNWLGGRVPTGKKKQTLLWSSSGEEQDELLLIDMFALINATWNSNYNFPHNKWRMPLHTNEAIKALWALKKCISVLKASALEWSKDPCAFYLRLHSGNLSHTVSKNANHALCTWETVQLEADHLFDVVTKILITQNMLHIFTE